MAAPPADIVHAYGLTAVPASASSILPAHPTVPPTPCPVSSTPIPSSALAARVQRYARSKLSRQTFHHSMRVYHYGLGLARQYLPDWGVSRGSTLEETFFLCAMLHDIGTTDANSAATTLSFELHGGLIALDLLQREDDEESGRGAHAPRAQAESVAESIVRHQDIGDRGAVSALTQLIQLATIFDNVGHFADYVHPDTVRSVSEQWPREGWLRCFAQTVSKEMAEKPWSTTTRLGVEEFPRMVLENRVMRPFE